MTNASEGCKNLIEVTEVLRYTAASRLAGLIFVLSHNVVTLRGSVCLSEWTGDLGGGQIMLHLQQQRHRQLLLQGLPELFNFSPVKMLSKDDKILEV